MSAEDKRRAAVHEAGHAIVAALLLEPACVRRLSIEPRPASCRLLCFEEHGHPVAARLAVLLAGRVAEQRLCGGSSPVANEDLEEATRQAAFSGASDGTHVGPRSVDGRIEDATDLARAVLEANPIALTGLAGELIVRGTLEESSALGRFVQNLRPPATRILTLTDENGPDEVGASNSTGPTEG